MAQRNILKSLSPYGLNPKEWSIRKLKSDGRLKIVWFQNRFDQNFLLKGQLQELGEKLSVADLEIAGI